MTREQKLALIVGFCLLLLVGVLISDHLSGARRAKIAKVEPEPAPLVSTPLPAPGPAPEVRVVTPATVTDPLQLILGESTPAPTPSANTAVTNPTPLESPTTVIASNPAPAVPVLPDPAPIEPATLREEIARSGGTLVRSANGTWDIQLPTGTSQAPAQAQTSAPVRTIETKVGPIEALKTHTIKSGETLFQITQRYYGNGNLWSHLAKFNGMDRVGTIRVGSSIKIPSKDVLLGRAVAAGKTNPEPTFKTIKPAPAPTKPAPKATDRTKPRIELASYTVRRGDTLGEISQRTLGTSRRWQEIAELNNLDDEDSIAAGTVLKIPARRS